MTTITVTKTDTGAVDGMTQKDRRAYRRFVKKVEALEPGELFTLDCWFPRDLVMHRRHFAMLAAINDAQERFDDLDQLRLWLQVGAGHCEYVPGTDGKMVALPKSINFRSIDDAAFYEHHESIKAFLRGDHAQAFLWPHLSRGDRVVMVEAILESFERNR